MKIEKLEQVWDQHPVFHIDFANCNFDNSEELVNCLEGYLADWECLYGKNDNKKNLGDRFQYVLEQAYKKTGKKAVVLIDEYDKPLLDVLGEEAETTNRNILKGFYGTFKSADASLRFVLLTGVTKFSQITVFSGFNQPNDISMDAQYDAICGITEQELYQYFSEPILEMAEKFRISEHGIKQLLKNQYDGYHFSEEMLDIYNPFSLINAFSKKKIEDYWYRSGTPTYLVKLLEGHSVNIQKLISQPYEARYFMDYRADVEDPLAMLYQGGYLTIKGYNFRYNEYMLDYPNNEVKNGFVTLIANGYLKKEQVILIIG